MSRKDDSKAKDAIVTVNIDDFTRTRDSVIVSLATLQSAVSDLSRAYINHANTVLNRGPISIENSLSTGLAGGLATSLLENGLLGGAVAHHALGQDAKLHEKKKRKRAPADPNAPKRALTAYFLYMQHNRQQIAEELGPEASKKEVADEGTRRWLNMNDDDKEVWKRLYQDNLAVYRARMEAYKSGEPIPDDDHAKADSQLQQSVAAAEAEAEEETESSSDEDEEEEESDDDESSKEPTPPPSSKRRRTKAPASPVSAKKASPEKKKQTPASSKKDATPVRKPAPAPAASTAAPSTAGEKRSKKKRKSEAASEE